MIIDQLKPVARKIIPYPARRWFREKQRRMPQRKQELYERLIVRKQLFTNREGFANFDFTLSANRKVPGTSALLRVKNEADKIYHCLASIYDTFDEIIVAENGSDDQTPEIVGAFKAERDKKDKIKIYAYPFRVARCGPEHRDTPEDSIHSLTYYYNWALSHCSRKYVCKWDGDMVMRKKACRPFKRLLKQIQSGPKMCWVIHGQTVYRDLQNQFYLAKGEVNGEVMIFPAGLTPRFYKVDLFEALSSNPALDERRFTPIVFYELKFASADEFSHWSIRDIPTARKQRELRHFEMIKNGDISDDRFAKLSPHFLNDQIA